MKTSKIRKGCLLLVVFLGLFTVCFICYLQYIQHYPYTFNQAVGVIATGGETSWNQPSGNFFADEGRGFRVAEQFRRAYGKIFKNEEWTIRYLPSALARLRVQSLTCVRWSGPIAHFESEWEYHPPFTSCDTLDDLLLVSVMAEERGDKRALAGLEEIAFDNSLGTFQDSSRLMVLIQLLRIDPSRFMPIVRRMLDEEPGFTRSEKTALLLGLCAAENRIETQRRAMVAAGRGYWEQLFSRRLDDFSLSREYESYYGLGGFLSDACYYLDFFVPRDLPGVDREEWLLQREKLAEHCEGARAYQWQWRAERIRLVPPPEDWDRQFVGLLKEWDATHAGMNPQETESAPSP